ncbi:MAG: M48 family metalloprotease [Deltaproteobacteria bacterium]
MAPHLVAPDAITCPRCGTPNREDAWFCNLCQEPFRKASRTAEPPFASAGLRGPAAGLRPTPAAAPRGGAPAVAAHRGPPPAGRGARPGPMLSFYDAAAANARNTAVLFAALFAAFFLLGGLVGQAYDGPGAGVALAAILFAILASAAWFGGASIVLSAHGAREADPERNRVLLNVVEEMAIAAGLPTPRVYVMETDGMNAFAAGRKPAEAVVAVTTGLVDRLNREELQGVVAHELAHIKTRDTLYNICAAVLVGAVALLSDMFLRGSFFRGRGAASPGGSGGRAAGKGGAAFLLLGILLAALAPLAAKLLQMSISRQREYHADAAAAGFTRNPMGLASALGKIARGGAGVPGDNRGTQHLFIVNPLRTFSDEASALAATHPPTERRIQRLKAMAGIAATS